MKDESSEFRPAAMQESFPSFSEISLKGKILD
jgi:hypothetical protein